MIGGCGIYSLHNTANGKRYVGQSACIKDRVLNHTWKLEHGTHYNTHLQNAYIKYGAESFEFSVLEEVLINMLDEREKAWITYYKSNQPEFGYNLQNGGTFGKLMTKETRLKMAKSKKGTRPGAECMRRSKEVLGGVPLTTERKQRIARKLTGVPLSLERRLHMKEAAKRAWAPGRRRRLADGVKESWVKRKTKQAEVTQKQ